MSYKINKTNGDLLVDLIDGQVDTTSTNLTLVGRNYKGFGEFINENFVRQLENFASSSAPSSPLIGQLWYDTAEERLKLYTGDTFRSASGAVVSQTQPNLVTGDLWVDSLNNKLYFYDGADIQLVGPNYSASQGKTGFEAVTILDENGQDQVVSYLYINNILTGILSRRTFRPRVNITGYPVDANDTRTPKRQLINIGFNPTEANFWFRGTAQASRGLISDAGEEFSEANFMKTDRNTATTGAISIKNPDGAGIDFGLGDTTYAVLKVDEDAITTLEVQQANKDFALRVKRGVLFDDVLYADSNLKRTGIYTNTPTVGFDVNTNARINGDLTIEGDITVNGDTTFINTSTLQVEDINIELATINGAAAGNDAFIDGAGITIKSTDGDKQFLYNASTNAWESAINLELSAGANILINGISKLSEDRLDNSILYAEGLVSIGTLQDLDVDNINLNGETITTSNPLNIVSSGQITVNNQKISGVSTPVSAKDAALSGGALTEDNNNLVATKGYVDRALGINDIALALDLTGYSNPNIDFASGGPYNDVINLLNYMHPSINLENDTEARIIATSYSSTTVTGIEVDSLIDDPNNPGQQISAVSKSFVSVYVDPDDSSTPQLETVLADVSFSPITANAVLVPSRAQMDFIIAGGAWTWVRTTPIT